MILHIQISRGPCRRKLITGGCNGCEVFGLHLWGRCHGLFLRSAPCVQGGAGARGTPVSRERSQAIMAVVLKENKSQLHVAETSTMVLGLHLPRRRIFVPINGYYCCSETTGRSSAVDTVDAERIYREYGLHADAEIRIDAQSGLQGFYTVVQRRDLQLSFSSDGLLNLPAAFGAEVKVTYKGDTNRRAMDLCQADPLCADHSAPLPSPIFVSASRKYLPHFVFQKPRESKPWYRYIIVG
ncbi:hypothetical protein EYR41_010558 [Orbilia oligospora]|uniref:Uncharacterized protein n=1 Tax=Orbilia oligospora TaxID=2813651 RepID=A0A8H2DV59_ORBOL|nr:hypothetical protein EYR41_010558 [Orbilia oligospora]